MASEHRIQVQQERTFLSGTLSVTTTFRLVVTGDCDIAVLGRLIRILTLQQDLLKEMDNERAAEQNGPETTKLSPAAFAAFGAALDAPSEPTAALKELMRSDPAE